MSALRARIGSSCFFTRRLLQSVNINNSKILSSSQYKCNYVSQDFIGSLTHKNYSTATASQNVSETVKGQPEKKEFQAETRMLLDIVARSLYSEKEVFIRELISNASDALEKFRYLTVCSVADADKFDKPDRLLEIRLTTDKQNRTITFEDTGIGMTKDEMIQNLGTIARSGSKSFIEQVKKHGAEEAGSIIGQFGVGFYSAFMVADKIEVFTRSSVKGSAGYKWSSDGSGSYEIQEAENVPMGTKIILYLKGECREYSDEDTVKNIIKKYSNFIGSPIILNESQVNSIKPLWLMEPKEVKYEEHTEFYKFISNSFDKPRFTLHYKTDVPLSIRAVLYVPEGKPGLFELSKDNESGVALYSRKILIKSKADNLVPKWLRFVKGVVDSEDIPLNLSREMLQNSALITKLRSVLTSRFLKFMVDTSHKDPVGYDTFYKDYSLFLKEGIVTSQTESEKEDIAKLLRFESSKLERGVRTSLSDYLSRQNKNETCIYYLAAPNRDLAETSPYFESLKKRDIEVLFCYEMYDELVLLELKAFNGKNLHSVENEMLTEDKDKPEGIIGSEGLEKKQIDDMVRFIKDLLPGKVYEVRTTSMLESHPCCIVVPEMGAARHFIRTQAANLSEDNRYALLRPQLELNPKHPLIKKLSKLIANDRQLANMVVQQLFANAMVTAGLMIDPRNLISNINELLVKALDKH